MTSTSLFVVGSGGITSHGAAGGEWRRSVGGEWRMYSE